MKQKNLLYLAVVVLFLAACGTSSATQLAPTIDVGSIQTAAAGTFLAQINQTSTLTNTPIPIITFTAAFTITPEFTPTITLTPQVTLPAGIASCIPKNTLRETAMVLGIVDGDTINVQLNGKILPVHYIGVDAPETGKAFYGQAAQINQELVYSKTVTLIKDVSDADNNGVLLRYVVVDNIFVNFEMVNRGYANAVSSPPDIACSDTFANAQSQAQAGNLGMWIPTPAPSSGGNTGNCDPSYPTVCIPPPPPDLDCKDIPYKRFTVLSPDPHRFDTDGDGIGCES